MIVGAVKDRVGFIRGSAVVLAAGEKIPSMDPHLNMTSNKFDWWLVRLLNLDDVKDLPKVVICLDNARYHQARVSYAL